MKALVLAHPASQAGDAIGFAQQLGEDVEITIVATGGVKDFPYRGVTRIISVGDAGPTPGQLSQLLLKHASGVDAIVAPSLKDATDAIARASALLGIPMFTEVNKLDRSSEGQVTVSRPVVAGRAFVTYRTSLPAAFTVAKKAFPPQGPGGNASVVEEQLPSARERRVGVEEKQFSGVNIEEAEVVVGVGRGFKRKEDLTLAEELARLLNGAVGCSRPITADLGWLPEDAWIGISGKRIRPKLYMPIGISGAPQHMSAAMDAKLIIAINKDKGAPVFQYADYGFVIDLYKLLPVFIEKLRERKKA